MKINTLSSVKDEENKETEDELEELKLKLLQMKK